MKTQLGHTVGNSLTYNVKKLLKVEKKSTKKENVYPERRAASSRVPRPSPGILHCRSPRRSRLLFRWHESWRLEIIHW